MELRIFVEPQQGASYSDLLVVAQTAEELGFDGFFVSDHYVRVGTHFSGLPGPTDAWTTLAGVARETQRIRLGTLVSPVTYRHPGVLAVQVAQVDQMSGGRVELGLGTGWFEREHRATGIPFPKHRFGMLEEQLEILTGLWATPIDSSYTFAGEHYQLEQSPALPKPIQSRIPVIVGGAGAARTPALAARFASEFNAAFPKPDEVAQRFARIRDACTIAGRDPDDLVYSVAMTLGVGRSDAEGRARAETIGRDYRDLCATALGGTVSAVVYRLRYLQSIGVGRVYLQVLDVHDRGQLELVAAEIMPLLR